MCQEISQIVWAWAKLELMDPDLTATLALATLDNLDAFEQKVSPLPTLVPRDTVAI